MDNQERCEMLDEQMRKERKARRDMFAAAALKGLIPRREGILETCTLAWEYADSIIALDGAEGEAG